MSPIQSGKVRRTIIGRKEGYICSRRQNGVNTNGMMTLWPKLSLDDTSASIRIRLLTKITSKLDLFSFYNKAEV